MQSHLLRCTVAVLASVSSTLLDPVPAGAQGDDPDAKAYFTYQLTMPKYKKYLSARVTYRPPVCETQRWRKPAGGFFFLLFPMTRQPPDSTLCPRLGAWWLLPA